jgi:hypothetical protein
LFPGPAVAKLSATPMPSEHSTVPATYDSVRGRLAFYMDSYWGGQYYREPSSPTMGTANLYVYRYNRDNDVIIEEVAGTVRTYLVPHAGERPSSLQARHSLASYCNFIAPIVDAYADSATARTVRKLGSLEPYMKNLNGRGRTWDQHMGEVARWDAVYGFTCTLFDTPKTVAANAQVESDTGAGIRAILIHPTAIAWIEVDETGDLCEFAFVDQPYVTNLERTPRQQVSIYVYTKTTWEKRTASVDTGKGMREQKDLFFSGTKDAGGPLAMPGEVPVKFSFFREVTSSRYPFGNSLVNDACDVAREVYNCLSNITDIHRKTAFPFLAIPQKSASGNLDPDTKVAVGPDVAMGYPSETGEPRWVQPSAEQTRELREHCIFLIGTAYRMAGLEVSTEGTTDVQSGIAIQLKSRGFEGRCSRFAANLDAYEHDALGFCARLLGKPADFAVTYPKRFVLPDSAEDLARALEVLAQLGQDLGDAGWEATVRQALDAALSLSDTDLAVIVAEMKVKHATKAAPAPSPGGFRPGGGPSGGPPAGPPPIPPPPPGAPAVEKGY